MRVQIAAFPKCWIEDICTGRMPLTDWILRATELQCEGLELYSGFLASTESRYLGKLRSRIESLGMQTPMMCHSPDFTRPAVAEREQEVKHQISMIRASAELGASFCRTLSGQRRPGVSVKEGVDWVVKCIETCLPEAEKAHVHLVMENHYKDGLWEYPEFAQRSQIFMVIVNRIDSPWFGVQYDPSNALVAGDDPIEVLEQVLPKLKTIHASDRYLKPGVHPTELEEAQRALGYSSNLVHGVTGKGLIDYPAVFSRLREIDFQGWVSVEDGMNGMGEMKESVDFLKRMRAEYS